MTDPRDELLDVVDRADRVVGTARREEVYAGRLPHRTVMVLVSNSAGQLLVHRRSAGKLVAPSLYDMTVGGVVGSGESYDACAARELAEEVGADGAPLERLLTWYYEGDLAGAPYPQWIAVYATTWDGPVVPQESEVAWWGWWDAAEIERRMAAGVEFCADSVEAWRRCRALGRAAGGPAAP